MKKILLVLVSLVFLFVFVSCGESGNQGGNENPPINGNEGNENQGNENQGGNENEGNKEQELEICIPEDRPLRVAQFADIHFGVEGKNWHNDKVQRTKDYIEYIVETQNPDLIVCSGDNILSTGVNGINEFISYMEQFETPWLWAYGNHDAENVQVNYRKSDLSKTLVEADTKYLLYEEGYIEEAENRYGNYSVKIYNSNKDKLLGAFIVLDSGEHDYSKGEYQYITPGQINWYKNEIDKLQEIYLTQSDNQYEIIPTIVFAHIQLPEFRTAYEKAVKNDGAEFVIEQELSQTDIEEIGSGGPVVNSGFYDVLVEKGSTKAYFVGHAHTFLFQVKMNGIVLGFAPQTGFSKLFANNDDPRKTYIYNFSEDLTFTTDCCNEIVKDKGLVFAATNGKGHANYIEETGVYTFTTSLGLWGRVTMDYYGEETSENCIRLTLNNTTVTGEINLEPNADWTTKLYCSDGDSGVFLCSKNAENIYKFTYNPTNNSLHIEVVEKLELEAGELAVLGVNKNSNLTVWKNSGFAVKTDKNWCSSTAKLFIIVDSEGRIVYSVYTPEKGYGEPTSNSYYTHPFYETDRDYTTNPAIVITNSGYKIVVPEGGFAISASGDSLIKLVNIVLDSTVTTTTDLIGFVLDRNSYNPSLRISYDAENKVISTRYVE